MLRFPLKFDHGVGTTVDQAPMQKKADGEIQPSMETEKAEVAKPDEELCVPPEIDEEGKGNKVVEEIDEAEYAKSTKIAEDEAGVSKAGSVPSGPVEDTEYPPTVLLGAEDKEIFREEDEEKSFENTMLPANLSNQADLQVDCTRAASQ